MFTKIENDFGLSDVLNTEVTTDAADKKAYEKPALVVVKFMFESDITFGSFDNEHSGENEFTPSDDWWDWDD